LKISKNSVTTKNEDNNNNNNNISNSNNNNNTNNLNSSNNNNNSVNKKDQINVYIKCLEQKVRDQAARLSDAEIYRYLCEKKIKQLNPLQSFPITENHLKENHNINTNTPAKSKNNENQVNKTNDSNNFNESSNSNRAIKINNPLIPLPVTQSNINQGSEYITIEKYQELKEKYEKLKYEKDFFKENNSNLLNNIYDKLNEYSEIEEEYYNIDSFSENETKKKYKKLFLYFKKVEVEKNNFIELFRKEKGYTEELKKENILLKESIENEIIKFGYEKNLITNENMFDLNKIKAEIHLNKKECAHFKSLTEAYFHEIENLKNINQMLLKNKEKILHNFEEGLKDLETMKEKIKYLENENLALINQLQTFNQNNDCINYKYKNQEFQNHNNTRRNNSCSHLQTDDHLVAHNKNANLYSDNLDNIANGNFENIRNNIVSNHGKVHISKHNLNQTIDDNTLNKKSNYENTQSNIQNIKSKPDVFYNNQNTDCEIEHRENNFHKGADLDVTCNHNMKRPSSSMSHGKLFESSSSRNNFYTSNNNFHSSNSNDILLNRLNEYKKNYEKLNNEFEELIKVKSSLEVENSNLKNQIVSFKERYNNLENLMEEKAQQLKEHKVEKEKWSQDFSNMINKINEISSTGNSESHLMISLKEYRRLYEETNLELEEFKNSNTKKIKSQAAQLKIYSKELKEKNKQVEKLYNENQSLVKEKEEYRSSYEKIDTEKQILNDYEKIKEKELNLAFEDAERLKKHLDSISQINKNLERELDELKTQRIFDKQKFDSEINIKDRELDEMKLLYENSKKENQKFKESKKDSSKLNYSTYISQEIETLNNQLNEYILKEKEYNLTILKLEKLEKENEKLNCINEEGKKNRISLELQISELVTKKESLEKEITYLKKNTEFSDDIYNEKNKEIDKLKKLITDLKNDYTDLESKLNNQLKEKEKLEEKNYELQNDFNRKKDAIDKFYIENLNLNDKIANYKVNLNSLFGELKVNLNKLNQKANEDLDSLLSKEFSQNILKLVSIINNFILNNNEEKSIFELTKDFINVSLNEFESIYERLLENNVYMQECNQKIILLEDNLNNRNQEFNEVLQNENKYKNKYLSVQGDFDKLNNFIKELKDENTKLKTISYSNNSINHNKMASEKKNYAIQDFNNIKTSFDEECTFIEKYRNNESINEDLRKEIIVLKNDLEKCNKEKINFLDFLQV